MGPTANTAGTRQGELDRRGVEIIKDGKPIRLADLKRGDKLTAMIVTGGPPTVLTAKEVEATLSKVDPASIQALRDMGAFLQSLKRFHVATEVTGERVLADGQKLQHTATAKMDVERPNKIRALMQSSRSEREIIYDGKTVTLYTPAQKYYSTVEFTETIGGLIGQAGGEIWRARCRCRISSSSVRRRHRSTRSSRR